MTSGFLELRERAVALVRKHGQVDDDMLLRHVYQARMPPGLRDHLMAPLCADTRLARSPDGVWTAVVQPVAPGGAVLDFTVLALVTTGAKPERDRVAAVAALHVGQGEARGQFSQIVNPGRRVPKYVEQQLGVDAGELDGYPRFEAVVDDLLGFLQARPIVALEALLTWPFLVREARRSGRPVPPCQLLDLGQLADTVLDMRDKPTLGGIASQLGVPFARLGQVETDARTMAGVAVALLKRVPTDSLPWASPPGESQPLRRGSTAQNTPDEPAVYILRDERGGALYVGKARRLRSRLASYVNRPLRATRRLDGLTQAVRQVDPRLCGTDLEALILEERDIRELQPRFNTQRRYHPRPTWIRLPPTPARGNRRPARQRLQLVCAPLQSGDGARYVGPFRNAAETTAARDLVRAVFQLDHLRRYASADAYVAQLEAAWAFLNGASSPGIEAARVQLAAARRAGNGAAARRWQGLLAAALAYDPATLLPADPRLARYAVVRRGPAGVEAFVVDRGVLVGQDCFTGDDSAAFAALVLAEPRALTAAEDVGVVLRWFGAQSPAARLVLLPNDEPGAVRCVSAAVADVRQASDAPRSA